MSVFASLDVYHDDTPRSAALNMSLDEALLEVADTASIRFYRWDHPALSFGYFGKFEDVAHLATQRDLVRRWTGGGIVLHGDDLTYSVVIPASAEIFSHSSKSIYAEIHCALRDALVTNGVSAELASLAGVGGAGAAVTDRGYNGESCFTNPVLADVLVNGQKVAGAAHRRTRAGLLHQGSIQHGALGIDFAERFASQLSDNCSGRNLNEAMVERARQIAEQKYGMKTWLCRR